MYADVCQNPRRHWSAGVRPGSLMATGPCHEPNDDELAASRLWCNQGSTDMPSSNAGSTKSYCTYHEAANTFTEEKGGYSWSAMD